MKKITATFTLLAIGLSIQAQGLFGIGSQDLGKKKIERITLTVFDSLNLSPSSLIRLGVTAYDKKKAYQTTKLGGDYYLIRSFKVEVSNQTNRLFARSTGCEHC